MRVNTAKEKMLRGEPAYGYSLASGSPLVAEALSHSGIDWLMIDTQHGSWGPESTIQALSSMAAGAAVPMARVARNDYTLIGRLLDEGILGIVVPMVDTVEQARAVATACRFPPRGNRSWGWGRARNYGPDYGAAINDQLFVAIQIESAAAVEHAEEIMGVDGIDGCWVGPADLSFSLGFHPSEQASRSEHKAALERVLEACRKTGKVPGIACQSPTEARQRVEQGFRFVTAGGDLGLLLGAATEGVKLMQG
jgi:4-hydroxy-2-oxoheptanedioate aldolase